MTAQTVRQQFEQALRHHQTGRVREAELLYRQLLGVEPSHGDAWNNLGIALKMQGELDEAIRAFRQALAIDPQRAQTWAYLGHLLKDIGQLDEAIESYRRGLAIAADPRIGSSLLMAMQTHPRFSARQLYEEHRRWNQIFAEPLKNEIRPHANDRDPEKRLRIGYVAATLGNHALGRFLLPLLENHSHEQFEILCYCDSWMADSVGQQLRECSDIWRLTAGMTDEQLASLVREDRIDILVDLNLHAAGNRLLTFARKPAPLQVTFLAYCGTSGLDTIDYRLSDAYFDPPGGDDSVYSEKTLRLRSYWCYRPPPEAPPVANLPCKSNGFVTFGGLNSFGKVTVEMLKIWCDVLRQTPQSRLILHAYEGTHRQRLRDLFRSEGVDPNRLIFVGYQPLPGYFSLYNQIDVCLDTSPWSGGTTTCDALWMGVPVVSLAGETSLSRAGLSILSNIGLAELATLNPREYVQTSVQLAGDMPRLAELRLILRERMQASPLMDAAGLVRDVQAVYRMIWKNWCSGKRSY